MFSSEIFKRKRWQEVLLFLMIPCTLLVSGHLPRSLRFLEYAPVEEADNVMMVKG